MNDVKKKVTLKSLDALTGKLSNPSKMPGYAWGIPAALCKRGGKLHAIIGSVCFFCYARKGRYAFPNVFNAYLRRWKAYLTLDREVWKAAMAELIARRCAKEPYLRWLDSGDLQNDQMLDDLMDISRRLPQVNFWLSTRERLVVKNYVGETPANVVVRVSADMIGGDPPKGFAHTSGVETGDWNAKVSTDQVHYCPAPLQGNVCGACRACWDPNVPHVVYRKH
jgi:hypothetical protein